jgi:predicted nucleotidyltransferase component of viral defense system
MGSKLRALYQRRKGRDLFDLWLMLEKNLIDPIKVIEIFLAHCQHAKQPLTLFEKSLFEKSANEDFRTEIKTLITTDTAWDFEKAYAVVFNKIVTHLPGDAWNRKKN